MTTNSEVSTECSVAIPILRATREAVIATVLRLGQRQDEMGTGVSVSLPYEVYTILGL